MTYFNLLILGFREVYEHWFRSVLTMLGVILGVASVVTMSAIVEGLEKAMRDNIIIYGGLNKVLIRDSDPPDYQDHIADTSPGKTLNDVYALKRGATLLPSFPRRWGTVPASHTNGVAAILPNSSGPGRSCWK